MPQVTRRRASATVEHLAVLGAVVLAGVLALGAWGGAAARGVEGAVEARGDGALAHVVAPGLPVAPPPSVSREAGLAGLLRRLEQAFDPDAALARAVERADAVQAAATARLRTEGARGAARSVIEADHFTTDRRLLRGALRGADARATYEGILGAGFVELLRALGPGEHWIDMGSGEGHAIRDFFRDWEKRTGGRDRSLAPDVTALAFAPAATEDLAAHFPSFRAAYGRMLEDIPLGELRSADLISDVFGPLSYSDRVDEVLVRYGEVLRPGGRVVALLSERSLRSVDASGAMSGGIPTLQRLLRESTGLELESATLKSLADPKLAITLRRTNGPLRVPRLEVVDFTPTTPPARTYRFAD